MVVRYQSAIHDEGKTPGQDCGVCAGSQDGFSHGSVDNPGDDDEDDDDGHNNCGVCAGPQDWFFQGPAAAAADDDDDVESTLLIRMMMMMATMIVACVRDPRIGFSKVLSSRSSHPISSQGQVIGSQNCQNHKYLNVGDKLSKSLTSLGWQQHFLNLDTDE